MLVDALDHSIPKTLEHGKKGRIVRLQNAECGIKNEKHSAFCPKVNHPPPMSDCRLDSTFSHSLIRQARPLALRKQGSPMAAKKRQTATEPKKKRHRKARQNKKGNAVISLFPQVPLLGVLCGQNYANGSRELPSW
jgi:hypothetical protein